MLISLSCCLYFFLPTTSDRGRAVLATAWLKSVEYLLSECLRDKFANLLHKGKTYLEEMPFSIVTFGWRQILPMFLSWIQNHCCLSQCSPAAHHSALCTAPPSYIPIKTSQAVSNFPYLLASSQPLFVFCLSFL